MNHEELIKSENDGKIVIGIDRPMARQFYTRLPLKEIKEKTEESPYIAKAVVLLSFLGAPLSLFASIVLVFVFFGWWGLLAAPVFTILYVTYYSSSSLGNSKINGISFMLLLSITNSFLSVIPDKKISLIVLVFILSLWLARFIYCGSTFLLRCFILRNEKAYEFMKEHLVIKTV